MTRSCATWRGAPRRPPHATTRSRRAEHVDLRHFDIADRTRDRFTLLGSTTPKGTLLITGSFATGKDDYPETGFGLLDNKHYIYALGFDASPNDQVTGGLSYNYEHYHGVSKSRYINAGLPNVNFPNPAFDWSTDSLDQMHSLIVNVGYTKGKTGLKFWWDYNKTTSTYSFVDVGPSVLTGTPAAPLVPLAPVKSSLNDITFDLTRDLGTHRGRRLLVLVREIHDRRLRPGSASDSAAGPEPGAADRLLVSALHGADILGTRVLQVVG